MFLIQTISWTLKETLFREHYLVFKFEFLPRLCSVFVVCFKYMQIRSVQRENFLESLVIFFIFIFTHLFYVVMATSERGKSGLPFLYFLDPPFSLYL